jgi:hypothetical protein
VSKGAGWAIEEKKRDKIVFLKCRGMEKISLKGDFCCGK